MLKYRGHLIVTYRRGGTHVAAVTVNKETFTSENAERDVALAGLQAEIDVRLKTFEPAKDRTEAWAHVHNCEDCGELDCYAVECPLGRQITHAQHEQRSMSARKGKGAK